MRVVAAVGVMALALGAGDGRTVGAQSADVSVTLTDSPDPVELRQKLTYTINVKNQGPDDAAEVSLAVTLPATSTLVVFTAAPSRCSSRETGLTCNLGSLATGVERRVTITVQPERAGAAVAEVVASSTTPDPGRANNVARATTQVARLRLSVVDKVRIPKTPRAGQKLYMALGVQRSDTGGQLDAGRVTCPAQIAGRAVPVLVRDAYPSPTCVWRIPIRTAGKIFRGRITVSFRGSVASLRFALKVR